MRLLFFAIITMTGIGSWNRRRKPRVCHLQNQNGIVTPPLPLNAIVAQRGASVGMPHKYYWRRKSGGGDKKSSLFGKASIADGIPPAAENGRTRAPFWFAGKRLASFAPAIPHRTGSARRNIWTYSICKLGSKLENEKNLGVRKRKNYNYRLWLGRCDRSQRIF